MAANFTPVKKEWYSTTLSDFFSLNPPIVKVIYNDVYNDPFSASVQGTPVSLYAMLILTKEY